MTNIAPRDQNHVPSTVFEVDGVPGTVDTGKINQATGRILVDSNGGGGGTVTSFSFTDGNGFDGTVTDSTTTPALSLAITASGMLKGTTGAIGAATAGTDYVAPGAITTSGLTMDSARLLGRSTASTGAIEEITVGSGLDLTAGTLTATGGGSVSFGDAGEIPYTNSTEDDFDYTAGFTFDGTNFASPGDVSVGDDLLLTSSGAVINFNAGDVTITHSANTLTMAGGNLIVPAGGIQVGTGNTITLASTFTTSGANALTLTTTGATNVTFPTSGTLMANPMTTGGDVIYGGASGVPTRLANGSAGQVLTSAGTTLAPTWSTPNASTITVANEASDTTCFPVFVTAATGNLAPKTNAGLAFNSSTAQLTATLLVGTTSVTSATVRASSNDSGSLGASGTAFSDLFLASGAVIDFAAGNSVITHSSGVLDVTTGDLQVSTAGTNADSVVTNAGTQTLTNKRVNPRTASSTTSATLTPDLSSANVYYRTTQTETLAINAPTGTPVIGEVILIYVDSAGAQTLNINATFIPFGAAFPATTTAGKTFMMSAQFNGTNWNTLWANAV